MGGAWRAVGGADRRFCWQQPCWRDQSRAVSPAVRILQRFGECRLPSRLLPPASPLRARALNLPGLQLLGEGGLGGGERAIWAEDPLCGLQACSGKH